MSHDQEPNEEALSVEEIAYWNMIQNEALFRILVRKGITSKEEFIGEVHTVHEEYQNEDEGSGEGSA
jgi:hypothetical protein